MLKDKKKIIVTGVGGFIGYHTALTLLERNLKVYGFYHSHEPLPELTKYPSFNAVKVDITRLSAVIDLFHKIKPSAVFNMAAKLPSPNNDHGAYHDTNVKGTLNLLEASRLNDVTKFIQSSSMSVYGLKQQTVPVQEEALVDPYDPYSLSKKLSEDVCLYYYRQYKLKVIILRYAGVYGPLKKDGAVLNFITSAVRNKPLEIKTNICWDLVYVKDVAHANYLAYLKSNLSLGRIINIGSGKEQNIVDLAKQIVALTKSQSNIKIISSYGHTPYRFYLDISKAKRAFGYKPTEIEIGLESTINYIKHDRHHSST